MPTYDKREPLTKMFDEMFHLLGDDEIDSDMFNEELNHFLDRLVEEDYFGTEAQNDPRGDQRDA